MRTKYFNATIITCNENFDIYKNGTLIVNNDKIEYVGSKVIDKCDIEYDCMGAILMPGFINCCYKYIAGKKAYDNQLKNGITSVINISGNVDIVDSKIRQIVGLGINDEHIVLSENELTNKVNNLILEKVIFGSNATKLDEVQYEVLLKVAKKQSLPFTISTSKTLDEVGESDKIYKATPIEMLESFGMFDIPCVISDAIYVDKDECEILCNYNVSVALLPSENLDNGYGIAPAYTYLKKGINVCLGTKENMFQEMFLLGALQRGTLQKKDIVTDKECILSATSNGAKAFKLNEIGILQKGKKCDIIIIEGNVENATEYVAHNATPANILLTIVDGEIVYKK